MKEVNTTTMESTGTGEGQVMGDPRETLWHAGREVAAGSREAMLAVARLMLMSKPKLEPLPSYNLPTEQRLSEAVAIIRRQSAEIDDLKELVLTGDIARTNLRSDVERLRDLIEQGRALQCMWCKAFTYESRQHDALCPAFTPEGEVK